METEKIFLEKNRSINSVNKENHLEVDLDRKVRLLPNDSIVDKFSLYDQYNRERDECTKFRVIATVNPVCSNILFNMKSEIMTDEGSDNSEAIYDGEHSLKKDDYAENAVNTTSDVTYKQAIRDCEYTHSNIGSHGAFVYHCGVDIFNNHMLRNDGFVHINKVKTGEDASVYNTICDYLRNEEGSVIEEDIKVKYAGATTTPLHIYTSDNLLSMSEAFLNRCKEKDGWWGFTNPGNIEIPNGVKDDDDNDILINRMMANNKACEFIDLYPDRSLFSFVPKFNKARRRAEKNWDYCLTYPYAKDEDKINEICGGKNQAIKVNVEKTVNNSSTELIQCSSYFKHNLKVGDYVYFYYYIDHVGHGVTKSTDGVKFGVYEVNTGVLNGMYDTEKEASAAIPTTGGTWSVLPAKLEYQKCEVKAKVISVGDQNGRYKKRIFNVRYDDLSSLYNRFEKMGCFYKKVDHNVECNYYLRLFKKIRNVSDSELSSDINKVAFGENIYGDDIAQIVFTDDVDVNGLVDNNGRPVSEIYLTVVKRNAGHKEFYSYNGTGTATRMVNDTNVEYSHCFGELTSGIDFSGIEKEPFDYNARYLHNLDRSSTADTFVTSPEKASAMTNTFDAWGDTVDSMPKSLESAITIDNDVFYGDVVEFNPYEYTETTIGNVYHRFNTVQREMFDTVFMNIYHDVLEADDYDSVNGIGGTFSVKTCYLNHIENKTTEVTGLVPFNKLLFGNIAPEGYIYNPHTKIQIRDLDEDTTKVAAKPVNYSTCEVDYVFNFRFSADTIRGYDKEETFIGSTTEETYVVDGRAVLSPSEPFQNADAAYLRVVINFPVNYGYYCGDSIAFYNKEDGSTVWGQIIKVEGSEITLSFDKDTFGGIDASLIKEKMDPTKLSRIYYAFWSEYSVPTYASYAKSTGKFYWRNVVAPSELSQDSDLFDMPFTNGRFYVQKNINFFLKRQDPQGKYGLSTPLFQKRTKTVPNHMLDYMITGSDIYDTFDDVAMIDSVINTCW